MVVVKIHTHSHTHEETQRNVSCVCRILHRKILTNAFISTVSLVLQIPSKTHTNKQARTKARPTKHGIEMKMHVHNFFFVSICLLVNCLSFNVCMCICICVYAFLTSYWLGFSPTLSLSLSLPFMWVCDFFFFFAFSLTILNRELEQLHWNECQPVEHTKDNNKSVYI